MTASEKITQRIITEATEQAKAIIADAKMQAENIAADGKAMADKALCELKAAADKKAAVTDESAISAAKLSVRNAMLLQKREEIEKTLIALEQHLTSLPSNEYFDVLLSLAKRYATKEQGIMFLNSKDIERVPADFEKNLAKLNITVSTEVDNSIVGGFILKYKDIEQNADFKALIAEKKEELTDIINKELF